MLRSLFICVASLGLVESAVFDGTLDVDGSAAADFLANFCFDKNFDEDNPKNSVGTWEIKLTAECDGNNPDNCPDNLFILGYSDEPESWASVYKNPDMTCDKAIKAAKCTKPTGEEECTRSDHAPVTWECSGGSCTSVASTSNNGLTGEIIQHYDRWWFYAITRCDEQGKSLPFKVDYSVVLLNTQRSAWSTELGFDIMNINTFYLLMFIIFIAFFCVHMYGVRKLSQKIEYLHPMVKLFAMDLFLQLLSISFYMIHWIGYSHDGKGIDGLRQAGEVMDGFTRCLFMLIVILLGKGWTISGEELNGKKVIVAAIVALLLVHFGILLWKFALEDPASVTVDVPLQVILWFQLILWFTFAGYFTYCVFHKWRNEDNPVKRALYFQLGIVLTLWFFADPVVTFVDLAQANRRGWTASRNKVVEQTKMCFSMIGYAFLSYLLWPSRAEEYFNINKPDVMRANIDTYEQL